MGKPIEIFYSLTSPWAYLGWPRLTDLLARTQAAARFLPVSTGTVFAATGGLKLADRPPARRAYRIMELRRWQRRLQIPLVVEPRFFPTSDALAARMVIAHREAGGDPAPLSFAVLRACWAEERDIADPATLDALAGGLGLDGPALRAAASSPAVEARYAADTALAIAKGVFGVPAFVIGEEVFWGQDRLDFVEEALGTA